MQKNDFFKIVKSLAKMLLQITLFMFLPWIFENLIISGQFEIVTLNFTMHILTILACPLKIYVTGKRFFKTWTFLNPISMKISFTIKEYSFPL